MQDLNDLYFFVQVVDHRGFAPAARALGMQKSRLSRRVALLEERLGVRLIQRSTRRFAVTEIGQDYYRHCAAMLVEAEAAQETIDRRRAEPQGTVRVSCPPSLVYFQVGDMVARFMAECPKVEVHLDSTNRRVDVIGEGYDIAIRARTPPLEESDLVTKVLAHAGQRLVASPAVLAGLAKPAAPADLAALPSLGLGPSHREQQWCLEGPGGATALVRHKPRLITEDLMALRLAALNGVGVVQLPLLAAKGDLAAGTLVDVLPGWTPRADVVHAVFPSRRGLLPSVRALLDYLADCYAALAGEADAVRPGR